MLAMVMVAGLAAGARAEESDRFHFIDRDLLRVSGELVGIGEKSVQYRDATGRVRSLERAKLLAAYSRRHHGAAAPTAVAVAEAPGEIAGVLRLSDGQLVPGFLVTSAGVKGEGDAKANSDTIRWRSRRVGGFESALDRVVWIGLNDAPRVFEAAKTDVVLLSNADRLEGFVESIGSELVIEVGSTKNTVPIERVASIQLSSKAVRSDTPLVSLSDGSVLAARQLASTGTASGVGAGAMTVVLSLAGEGSSGVLDVGAIDAIVFEPASLVALASCPIVKQEALGGRRWAPSPEVQSLEDAPIGLATVTLSGPIAVEWKLPVNAKRLRATLALPEASKAWGNTTVTASLAAKTGAFGKGQTFELSADRSEVELGIECTGMERLRIEVVGRGYDQVQANVALLEPLVLVSKE